MVEQVWISDAFSGFFLYQKLPYPASSGFSRPDAKSEVHKPTDICVFSLPSIILTDFLGNRTLLKRVQKVKVGDLWLVDFDPFCVFLCFKVHCLWWLTAAKNAIVKADLNFRVRVFVKRAVKKRRDKMLLFNFISEKIHIVCSYTL